ncbi:MAG: hypothetical protein ACJ79S_03105 [Gemmatimonadaceae bacterium]
MRRRELSVLRALAIYAAGLATGVQGAFYLFDLLDDGVADVRSGLVALLFLLLSLALIARWFRARRIVRRRRRRRPSGDDPGSPWAPTGH